MIKPYVLAIDPGKKTGLALWCDDEVLETHELKFLEVSDYFDGLEDPDLVDVVIERFYINQKTAQRVGSSEAIEVIGVARRFTRDNLILQDRAIKKSVPNVSLMKLGWWHKAGDGHALDALRHLVWYLTEQKEPRLMQRLDELNL